ncbi:MAG TPA: hypothetical protein VGD37_16270 [Kofleriaceae bacterium]
MLQDLAAALETEPIEAFAARLRRGLTQLGVALVDGRVVAKSEAEGLAAQVLAMVAAALTGALADRPGDALRVLDAVRGAGWGQLEAERPGLERACARRFPPPPPVTWPELAELRALADRQPALCRIGPPVIHVEFAARLAASGTEVPDELLALYAACSHVELTCRHVAAPAGSICPGEALRVRDGRLILFERSKRRPAMMLIEQPGLSIAQALGTWWLVLEDDRAPATRRPLDLQGMLRFARLRIEAPSLEVLLTELAWRRFFA